MQADIKILTALRKMGCKISEKKGAISVQGPKQCKLQINSLKPLGTINANSFPDGAMTLAVLSAFAKGKTKLTGLKNLKYKESNRLKAIGKELKKIGTETQIKKDALIINGKPNSLHPATIETYNDHRIAMSFGMAKIRIPDLIIKNKNCVKKTYPDFWKEISKLIKKPSRNIGNIIITGMRGTGKTTLGKALAKHLGFSFIDLDEWIEQKTGKSVHELVMNKGWESFRKIEKKAVKACVKLNKTVIATGGGTMMDTQNAKKLKRKGFVILLTAEMKTIRRNLKKGHERPSLTKKSSTLAEIETIWKKRREKYHSIADLIHDTTNGINLALIIKKLYALKERQLKPNKKQYE